MVSKTTSIINPELYDYCLQHSVRTDEILQQANSFSLAACNKDMQSLPEALNLLQWLVITLKPRNILEVGSFTGLSALAMAIVAPEVKITCLEKNTEYADIAQQIWQQNNISHQIDLRLADALESCQQLVDEKASFELIFIDANKKYYPDYYQAALELVPVGGVIVVDNVFLKGRVIDSNNQKTSTQGVRKTNEIIFNDPKVAITTIPLADGLTLATRLV